MKAKKTLDDGQVKIVEMEEGLNLHEHGGQMYFNEEEKVFYIDGDDLRFAMNLFHIVIHAAKGKTDLFDKMAALRAASILDQLSNYTQLHTIDLIPE